jgi:hypothetical protein
MKKKKQDNLRIWNRELDTFAPFQFMLSFMLSIAMNISKSDKQTFCNF